MEIIVTLLLIVGGILGGDSGTAHGTAVTVDTENVVSTVSIGEDGSLSAFAG